MPLRHAAAGNGDHSDVMYVAAEEFDPCHADVVAAGAEIAKPREDERWGIREFGLRSVDGRPVMVGQRLR